MAPFDPQAEAVGSAPLDGSDSLVRWIVLTSQAAAGPVQFMPLLGDRLIAEGIPLCRIRVSIRTLHPQFIGDSYTWHRGEADVVIFQPPHTIVSEERYINSPMAPIFQGAGAIRRRLDVPETDLDYPVLKELRDEGATDYVAMPLNFSAGRISAITFATDRPGGFTSAELSRLDSLLPFLAQAFEIHALRQTARNILDTYLGHLTGERVLEGVIRRGDGDTIHAIIWFCDLRDSTTMAEGQRPKEFLDTLNEFFESVTAPVLTHGGEILSYLGDGALAIFPIDARTEHPEYCPEHTGACSRSLAAAREAMQRFTELNAARVDRGDAPLECGIALHLGDVLYGNVGVPDRLTFTVIGAAANETARLESMCKVLHKPLLLSAELARLVRQPLQSLGFHAMRGVSGPREIFTLADL